MSTSVILSIIFLAALVGHFALHIAIYNRLNATGLRRKTIKRIEKVFVLTTVALPLLFAWQVVGHASDSIVWRDGSRIVGQVQDIIDASPFWNAYGILCLTSLVLFGLPWLVWRPVFGVEWADARRTVRVIDLAKETSQPLALTAKCRLESRLPFNQIMHLSIDEIQLPVPGLPAGLDGLRIAHLSDLHFTGHIAPAFFERVFAEANAWKPDLCVVTGDIIDKDICMPWLKPVFSTARSLHGNYFILGNHDTRVRNSSDVRRHLTECGWIDVGGKLISCNVDSEVIEILGNEAPWFAKPTVEPEQVGSTPKFRILLSHSPDQLSWARRNRVQLMLAGHTHGGQGRLPLIGPVLSPSWHGSRYASGDFWKPPTTLHVSRGLSGVHLLRIHCPPELSLLTLRAPR